MVLNGLLIRVVLHPPTRHQRIGLSLGGGSFPALLLKVLFNQLIKTINMANKSSVKKTKKPKNFIIFNSDNIDDLDSRGFLSDLCSVAFPFATENYEVLTEFDNIEDLKANLKINNIEGLSIDPNKVYYVYELKPCLQITASNSLTVEIEKSK